MEESNKEPIGSKIWETMTLDDGATVWMALTILDVSRTDVSLGACVMGPDKFVLKTNRLMLFVLFVIRIVCCTGTFVRCPRSLVYAYELVSFGCLNNTTNGCKAHSRHREGEETKW